jgi:hypothetical protein
MNFYFNGNTYKGGKQHIRRGCIMAERLNSLLKTNLLEGKRILITGCGFKVLKTKFNDLATGKETYNSIVIDGQEMKINIGTAAAFVLAANGATVHLVARTEEHLKAMKENIAAILKIPEERIEYSAIDLLDEYAVEKFVDNLPKDKPIWWVQSIGLGAGAYKLKDDNPYLRIEEIPLELLEMESAIVLKGTHILMRKLLPVLREQNRKPGIITKIAIVTSMSAMRGYDLGGTHCASKGAIDRYTNAAMMDLVKENIFITAIRPGIIDTGMYDGDAVIEAVKHVGKNYGFSYSGKSIPLAPPISVGEAILTVLASSAHITSVNIVANEQWPNEGS